MTYYVFDGFMTTVFPIIFMIMFVTILGVFIYSIGRAIATNHKNNQSPRLDVEARVVTKRMYVSHSGGGHDGTCTGFTHYYATFEVRSGDRMELEVPDNEYGLLVEGDNGTLSFQGTRYLGFVRH